MKKITSALRASSIKKSLARKTKLRLTIAFILILLAGIGIFSSFEATMYYQRQENYVYLAENQARLMEGSMSTVMARAYTLRALVVSNDGNTDFFNEETMKDIYQDTVDDTGLLVKNLIVAPNGVVEFIYPMEGNEALVGMDYMDTSQAGNEEAVAAYMQNELVVTEPFSLKQGGIGIAGRLPVFLEENGESEFWGMVSVTLDFDYLLDEFNLDYLEQSGANYSLWYTSEDGEKVVLAGSETEPKNPVSVEMAQDSLNWTLDVSPVNGWIPIREIIGEAIIIILVSFLLLRLMVSRARIRTMNAALEEIAIRDNLTGCFSRHFVNVVLLIPGTKEWRDSNTNFSLAVIDVDCFKQINDTYGHALGDLALIAIAKTLKKFCDNLRGDCVVRYGGDEFILLMNNVTHDLFEERLKAIVESVREIRLEEAPDMRLTVSVGAVTGNKSMTYYDLFAHADQQVYLAKENGKDRYCLEKS